MPERRRGGRWAIGLGCLTVAVALALGVALKVGHRAGARRSATGSNGAITAQSPLSAVAERLARGDSQALGVLYQRVMDRDARLTVKGLSEAEAEQWFGVLHALRTGYPRFNPYGRASAVVSAARILDKFAVEPAPSRWVRALSPLHDLLTAGLADAAVDVRVAALAEVSRVWIWIPGRDPIPVEDQALANWKEGLHAPVVRRLADPQPMVRASAVACLGALPIDAAASPAVAYVADPNPEVRRQTLVSFANRPNLLSEEAILKRFSDPDPRIPPVAESVLKARGLTKEQMGLGGLLVHPRPELRESVIPMLARRTDIDPVVWLLQLSHDEVESVRLKAAQALAGQDSTDARKRLAEMAVGDPSEAVKRAAAKLAIPGEETAALPPLPGSPSLTPKAN